MRLKILKVARKGTEATNCRLLIQTIGFNLLVGFKADRIEAGFRTVVDNS
jgi:hypothetical protein